MSGIANAARSAYTLAFQVSPIILTGGIVAGLPGAALPVIGLIGQLASFAQGALSSGGLSANDFFAEFLPVPGGNIINNAVGMYPFANQQVAANAIIEQPLNISLQMIAPVKDTGGYLTKLALFTALRTSFNQHNQAGGTYAVATSAYIYPNCLMTGMTDITGGDTRQQQIEWQIDFIKPVITRQAAIGAFSSLMGKLNGGQQTSGALAWSGAGAATGTQASGAMSLVAGAQNLAGAINSFLSGPL